MFSLIAGGYPDQLKISCLTLVVNFKASSACTSSVDMQTYLWPGYERQLLGGLQGQQNSAQFCDTLLQTEGEEAKKFTLECKWVNKMHD